MSNGILITGATGSIGGALARCYAEPGNTLILQGRDLVRLQQTARACEAKGARVLTKALDLTDRAALFEWLAELTEKEQIDLAIINAGVNTHVGPDRAAEDWDRVEELVGVNILSTMAIVHGLLPAMRCSGRGQIALMSSLAAYFGLPVTPSYSASKAAIKVYGEALRGFLSGENIRVNVIMPGYVDSAICRAMPGPKPFVWTADQAAKRIRRGLQKDQARIAFPFLLSVGTWFLSVFPVAFSLRILRWLRYGA